VATDAEVLAALSKAWAVVASGTQRFVASRHPVAPQMGIHNDGHVVERSGSVSASDCRVVRVGGQSAIVGR